MSMPLRPEVEKLFREHGLGRDMGLLEADYENVSLRDYFAGQALPWALAHFTNEEGAAFFGDATNGAYAIADAMLAVRERKP